MANFSDLSGVALLAKINQLYEAVNFLRPLAKHDLIYDRMLAKHEAALEAACMEAHRRLPA